ncbi:glycosyltransferase family 2 protein [Snodgrassella sp. CFCC 13594]|uniref:glycosyltransferase family 2 protein n=1 Tax=Snodgrassella sp. CFCC 13594 TaxID=1775559 RepID=UPI0009ECF8EC|nr:glycosyltransferase family 2 protein [Snodgrassella sp. CFCC 13594]
MIETNTVGLTVILPVYNDASVVDVFLPVLFELTQKQSSVCEVLLVDDGSSNRQALTDVYQKHAGGLPEHTALRLVRFSRNFGKEAALSAGLAQAQGNLVAMMDADGQHPVAVLQQMLDLYHQTDVDMVAAIQATRAHESHLLRGLKRGFYRFMQDTQRYEIKPNAGDFRLMNRKVVNALLKLPERQRFMKGFTPGWVFELYICRFRRKRVLRGRANLIMPAYLSWRWWPLPHFHRSRCVGFLAWAC